MNKAKEASSWLLPVTIGLVIALIIRVFFVSVDRIDGPSMLPNLVNNERVLCLKQAKIHRGSVVIFNANGVDPQASGNSKYVKRVIGLPGDSVKAKDGKIFVNGKQIKQDYISAEERDSGTGDWTLSSLGTEHNWLRNNGAKKVPAGEYFVLGDHRSVSNDGRYFGFVPKDKIDGVVKVMSWTGNKVQRNNVNDEWKEFY